MTELIAIITLAALCAVQIIVNACKRHVPVDYAMAQSIAKGIVTTYKRGYADGEEAARRGSPKVDIVYEPEMPLRNDVPYEGEEEDAQPDPNLVPVTNAPLED